MRKLILAFLLAFSTGAFAQQATTLLDAVTATGASARLETSAQLFSFQAYGTTSAGSGAATVKIEGSNVAAPTTNDWVVLGTVTLTLGTTSTADGVTIYAPWRYLRANVTAISGTTATVTALVRGR